PGSERTTRGSVSFRQESPIFRHGEVQKAINSCEHSSNNPQNHFVGADKMVDIGSKAIRPLDDYHLSRFACYLIAQNGDPRKPEIANAQKYFAIQTRKQELSEALLADLERLELRKQTSEKFKALSGAARDAGVQNSMFGIFHDAGYKGLYGGLASSDIKERKGILQKEQLMDRMGTTELAANQFRMTQTREKLKRENIKNQNTAIQTHEDVGKEVRKAIEKIGGILPENLPPEEPINNVKKRLKSSRPTLLLDEKEAGGLIESSQNIGKKM
ncbi:MAG: DNA damage-inducible protein D, partial [Chlamydiota bacterium]